MTQRITAAQLIADMTGAKRGRVRGTKRTTTPDGIRHDSKLEAKWWMRLCLRQQAGEISDLRRQVNIPLLGRDGPILTPTGRPMHYRADFVFIEDGREVVADAKGWRTEAYQMKRAILAAQGISIRELK